MATIIPPMVPTLSLRRWLLLLPLMAVPATFAARIVISGPGPQLHIAIGSLGSTIDTVVFDLAAASSGDGTPIAGSAPVQVEVAYKKQGPLPHIVTVTTDGSSAISCITPTSCGATSIPMSQISWAASLGQWPSGSFSGAANQPLLLFVAGGGGGAVTRREDVLSYRFANSTAYPAGTYQGRVTYTAVSF